MLTFFAVRMSTTTTLACVKNAPLVPYTSAKTYLPSGLTASYDAGILSLRLGPDKGGPVYADHVVAGGCGRFMLSHGLWLVRHTNTHP